MQKLFKNKIIPCILVKKIQFFTRSVFSGNHQKQRERGREKENFQKGSISSFSASTSNKLLSEKFQFQINKIMN